MFATLPAWLPPILLSAFGLGFYDLCKKHAVRDNPIMPVLFLATLCGSTFFVLAVVVTLATAGVVWWMFRPKAGKVVICEKCGARYAVVQPPKYTNGWNYDKIAPASGRELPEGEPASDEGSQAPAPASAPSAANSKES